MDIIKVEKIDAHDPHGYCAPPTYVVPDNKVNPGIPLVPWKRANLGNEVRALHILHKAAVIPPSTTGYMNKSLICKLIDDLLDIQRPKPGQVERVKRRLFIEARESSRKQNIPKKRHTRLSDAFKFRSIRHKIGYRDIKKNYLSEARKTVMAQIQMERGRKRSLTAILDRDSETVHQPKKLRYCEGKIKISTAKAVVSISPEKISEILRFHEKMARPQTSKERSHSEQLRRDMNTDACRLSRRVSKLTTLVMQGQYNELSNIQQQMIEESMRSSFMITILMNLIAGTN